MHVCLVSDLKAILSLNGLFVRPLAAAFCAPTTTTPTFTEAGRQMLSQTAPFLCFYFFFSVPHGHGFIRLALFTSEMVASR